MRPLTSAVAPNDGGAGSLVVSVVSHGHQAQVQALLNDLARYSAATVTRVVLTLNQPEAEPQAPSGGWPFALHIVRNAHPAGFGANHNRALMGAMEPFVCVLNPDVRWYGGTPWKHWSGQRRSPRWAVPIPLSTMAPATGRTVSAHCPRPKLCGAAAF